MMIPQAVFLLSCQEAVRAQFPHVDQSLLVVFFLRARAGWSRSSIGHHGLWEPGCSWVEGTGKVDCRGLEEGSLGTAFLGAFSLRGHFS